MTVRSLELNTGERLNIAVVSRLKHGDLYKLLKDRGWTQKQLAQELGVPQMTISNWMRLKSCPKDERVLSKLEALTGKLREDLFPKLMQDKQWKAFMDGVPKEHIFLREVELKELANRHILALPSTEDTYILKERKEALHTILRDGLSEREYKVISLRFGLDCDIQTLRETAKLCEVTGERVRQIELRALGKLREFSRRDRTTWSGVVSESALEWA